MGPRPNNFIHHAHHWQVQVGRAIVHDGRVTRNARRCFDSMAKLSRDAGNRASGQRVALIKDGSEVAVCRPRFFVQDQLGEPKQWAVLEDKETGWEIWAISRHEERAYKIALALNTTP